MRKINEKSVVMMVHDNRIDRRVLDEAMSLKKDGWEVTVIGGPPPTPGYRNDEDCYPDLNILRLDTKLPCKRNTALSKNLALANIHWSEIFWLHDYFIEKAIDIPAKFYVAHDLPQLPAAVILAEYYKGYVVYDSHELYPEQYLLTKKQKELYSESEELLLPYVDRVITVSNSFSKFMSIKYDIDKPEVILNCPAINPEDLPIENTKILHKNLNIDLNKKILLYQGGVSRYKNDIRNLEKLMLSMKLVKNPEVVLVFLGPGGANLDEFLEVAAENGLLNTRFFYHTAVPQNILLKYTASADAGIIPYPHIDFNTYFCSPNKMFEFMVAGLPILANKSPELTDFIGSQDIGINRKMDSVEEFASAIDDFFCSDILKFKKNIDTVSKKFIWDTQGKKITNIYSDILKRSPKSQKNKSFDLERINRNINSGKYIFARAECLKELENNPNNIFALNCLSLIELNSLNYSEALRYTERALKIEPYNEMLLNNLNFVSEFLYRKDAIYKLGKNKLEHYLVEINENEKN